MSSHMTPVPPASRSKEPGDSSEISMDASATRNEDERQFILHEWDKWAPKHLPAARNGIGSWTDAIHFFTFLQIERPRLLQFGTLSADPWQTVNSWLKQSRKVLGVLSPRPTPLRTSTSRNRSEYAS
jgi:hypothetical protein